MAKLRLFIAFELPVAMMTELERVKSKLRQRIKVPLKWVRDEGSHLTLKFLGYVEEGRIPAVLESMTTASSSHRPLSLRAGSLGSFGGRRPRVLWLGLEGDLPKLVKLHSALDNALARAGFQPEIRTYHPHLSLARVPERLEREEYEQISAALAALSTAPGEVFEFTEVSLMQSTLKPDGAVYNRLHAVRLQGR